MNSKAPVLNAMGDGSSGQLDAASKRRLQNRLNQRASRRRRALRAKQKTPGPGQRWIYYTEEAKAFPENGGTSDDVTTLPARQTSRELHFCVVNQSMRKEIWDRLENNATDVATRNIHSPSLIPIAQFNILRAMFANAAHMGLTMEILSEDIASYFNIAGPTTLHLPPSLQPITSQMQIVHHPWIDLIPISSMRNTLLSNIKNYDEEELCGDLYGLCASSREVGMVVWGEAWDPTAYEISERVLKKWNWLLRDCLEVLESTNYWRRMRGERPLDLRWDRPITEIDP